MSKLGKIAIILFIILIILGIIVISLIYTNRGQIIYDIDEIGSDEELYNFDTTLQNVTVRNDFYTVKGCVEKFYTYYALIFSEGDNGEYNEEYTEDDKYQYIEAIYDMLDEEYRNYKRITINNLEGNIKPLNDSIVNINKMYVSKKDINVSVYIVEGRLREVMTGDISDFKLILKVDALNKTFTVLLDDYVKQKYSNLKLNQDIDINISESIEKNNYNIYDYKIVDDETYVVDLIGKYKEEILFDTVTAYSHLDEEYKKERFETLDEFQTFARENIMSNVTLKLSKYKKTTYDDYTEYVCIDAKGKYYIFNEKSVMDYEMILDTYTVNLPEFIKKYDEGRAQVKVGLNINKVIEAINEKDYQYVYKRLNETYKNNYFTNLNSFIQYINNNFYDSNEALYVKFDNPSNNTYTYDLTINNVNNSSESNDITIIIRLLDNRDFEISFAMDR